ncbi:DEAD/DEAH box helicase [Myceligenerans halotolerans]
MTTTDSPAASAAETVSDSETPDYSSSSAIQAQNVTFADFGVREEIVDALRDSGITHPFPIQAMTLPVAMSGHDIIGQAKTGTGKTLGFGVPLLHRIIAPGEQGYDQLVAPGKPQAVVVVPTRELAVQVANDLDTASSKRSVRIVQVYGGRAYEPQIESLRKGVDVVVGTPGRMIDLMNQGHLTLLRAGTVVLDEADEMLDLGFLPDVEKILSRTPAQRHTMLFSATMPGAVVSMARRYMKQPTHIRAADPDEGFTVKNIAQVVYRAHALDKVEVLARILQAESRGRTIVFARTKRTAAKVADDLRERGFAAGAIHGDLGQGAREQALRAFRNEKIDVLVATDVAARGIDVDDVTHVVNYQCPEDERTYLHRTGRTGRAGNKGTAVTFVDWDDVPRWRLIDKALELDIPEPVETYSTSPHLFADLGIPEGTKGRLPREKRVLEGLDGEKLEDLGETGKRTSSGGRGQGGSPSGTGHGRGGRSGGGSGGRGRGGSSSDGGRSRSSATSDGGHTPDQSTSGTSAEGDGARRRTRSRRRTRGGRPATPPSEA